MSIVDDFLNELPKMVEPQLPKGKYTEDNSFVWIEDLGSDIQGVKLTDFEAASLGLMEGGEL